MIQCARTYLRRRVADRRKVFQFRHAIRTALDEIALQLAEGHDAAGERESAEQHLEAEGAHRAVAQLGDVAAVQPKAAGSSLLYALATEAGRVLTRDGRSRAYVNGQSTSLNELKVLGELLIDIHSQHEHQSLLKSATHQRLLDAFGGLQALSAAVQSIAASVRQYSADLTALKSRSAADAAQVELLGYQVKELDELGLVAGELPALESEHTQLSHADAATKAKLRRMPYWLALYAHDSGAGPVYPAPGNPRGLVSQYGVWSNWTIWQYGGVDWQGGRSRPKVYNHGSYRFSPYFGNLDRPTERNVFNGSQAGLQAFWQQHGLPLR